MTISSHAAAAKAIRTELKKHGIKARVTCSTYSMGDSVSVHINNQPPWVSKKVSAFAKQFQYGSFDSMQDLYEYTNDRDDIPQVKYVMISNDFDADMRQKAYDYLRSEWSDYRDFPADYDNAQNERGCVDWVSSEVWQVLNGSWDDRCSSGCTKFWHKPHIKLVA